MLAGSSATVASLVSCGDSPSKQIRSSRRDGGSPPKPAIPTSVSLQSSVVSAARCTKLASSVRSAQKSTFSACSEGGRQATTASVTLRQPPRSRDATPASAAPTPPPSTGSHATFTLTAAGSAARHRTTSHTPVVASTQGTPATTAASTGCTLRSVVASTVFRQLRTPAAVAGLPPSSCTSSGISAPSTAAAAVAAPAAPAAPAAAAAAMLSIAVIVAPQKSNNDLRSKPFDHKTNATARIPCMPGVNFLQ